jgi:hypothetical protein
LKASAGEGWPPDVAIGYGYDCEDGIGVPGVVEYMGGVKPGLLLPVETGGVLCPPLDESTNGEPDWPVDTGGVEVFTTGHPGEEGVDPGG